MINLDETHFQQTGTDCRTLQFLTPDTSQIEVTGFRSILNHFLKSSSKCPTCNVTNKTHLIPPPVRRDASKRNPCWCVSTLWASRLKPVGCDLFDPKSSRLISSKLFHLPPSVPSKFQARLIDGSF